MTVVDQAAWLRRMSSADDAAIDLVCLPHAGGGPGVYRPWADLIGADVRVGAICYPGRLDRLREPPINRMAPLADRVAEVLLSVADRPMVLFGHSMGGSVAHEVARRMAAAGFAPALLAVSGRSAPPLLAPRGVVYGGDEAILADVVRMDPRSAEVLAERVLREMVLPAIRADYELVEDYGPHECAPLDVPIAAYTGADDVDVPVDGVRGWASMTTRDFWFREFAGGHFYLDEHRPALVADIRSHLTGLGLLD